MLPAPDVSSSQSIHMQRTYSSYSIANYLDLVAENGLSSIYNKIKSTFAFTSLLDSEHSILVAMIDKAFNCRYSQDKNCALIVQLDEITVLSSPRLFPLPLSIKLTPSRLLTIRCRQLCASALLQEIPSTEDDCCFLMSL